MPIKDTAHFPITTHGNPTMRKTNAEPSNLLQYLVRMAKSGYPLQVKYLLFPRRILFRLKRTSYHSAV